MAKSYNSQDSRVLSASESESVARLHKRQSFDKSADDKHKKTPIKAIINSEWFVLSPEDIPDEYEIPDDDTGFLVIFNQEKFALYDYREGTNKDLDDLIDCFSRLRYPVREEFLFSDLTKEETKENLLKISQLDHSKTSSLIIVFLTHGDSEGKLYSSDDMYITCDEVWNYFSYNKCPTLKGKPKVFIFQACKGLKRSSLGSEVTEDSRLRVEQAKKVYKLPLEADVLIAYSTVEGYVSYRNNVSGSWFIQELCKNLSAYGRRDDLVTIITRVSKCVAYHYQTGIHKQMPCFISTLTRKFYLCKSKERGSLLDLIEQNKQMLLMIQNLQKQFNVILQEKAEKEQNKKMSENIKRAIGNKNILERPRWR